MLFGTTGTKLLRYCPCPVWLTKPGFSEIDLINVLVADDLRDVGMECLRIAVAGGQTRNTRTSVLHVIEKSLAGTAKTAEERDAILEQEREGAEQTMRERISSTDYRTLEHGVQLHVAHGKADEEIVKAIEEFEIDVLIMGTAGRSGLSGFLFGTTIERLLPQINCSVLAVKPAGFQCPVSAD
jgi:universal stress protein E